ncbi:DDRGK domain-containing protein 1-like [Schistocerca gregaria]|uniref:DDRGK domain-containing protein 1-like n=1 Tax=Schistocerca gregaria TaxID=7010 RepID=UPI00211E3102|nr:DDRGK domain-containing protein 1-like [Schistocerca gregaria]
MLKSFKYTSESAIMVLFWFILSSAIFVFLGLLRTVFYWTGNGRNYFQLNRTASHDGQSPLYPPETERLNNTSNINLPREHLSRYANGLDIDLSRQIVDSGNLPVLNPADTTHEQGANNIATGLQMRTASRSSSSRTYGKKKLAKLERKRALAEYHRHQAEQGDKQLAELRKLERERVRRKENEKKEAEFWEERKRQQEKDEEAEYLIWKEKILVEEEGVQKTQKDMLFERDQLVRAIKKNKFVELESLGLEFQIDVQILVRLVTELVEEGLIDGIFDGRGYFIYFTDEEKMHIIKIIEESGRVTAEQLTQEFLTRIASTHQIPGKNYSL